MDEINTIKAMVKLLKKDKKVLISELATTRAENKWYKGKVTELDKSVGRIERKNEDLRKSQEQHDQVLERLSKSLDLDEGELFEDEEEEEDRVSSFPKASSYSFSRRSKNRSNFSSSFDGPKKRRKKSRKTIRPPKYEDLKKEYAYQVRLNRKLEKQLEKYVLEGEQSATLEKKERSYQNRKIEQLKSEIDLEKRKVVVLESKNEKLSEKIKGFRKRMREDEEKRKMRWLNRISKYRDERDEERQKVNNLKLENKDLRKALTSLNRILEETKMVKELLENELAT